MTGKCFKNQLSGHFKIVGRKHAIESLVMPAGAIQMRWIHKSILGLILGAGFGTVTSPCPKSSKMPPYDKRVAHVLSL